MFSSHMLMTLCGDDLHFQVSGSAGGLIFGWNALAIMLKDQGNYNANCPPGEICAPLQQVSGALQTNECGLWTHTLWERGGIALCDKGCSRMSSTSSCAAQT